MADFLITNAFRVFSFTLNYLSPSIIADIILHPFDFATVLLQIGFDPEGLKNETTTLVSALAQYALFTFYIPYLFTSMQGVQYMGLSHPSMFYYVSYIYNRDGIFGCYRGILPKICERMVMMCVNETVKHTINGVPAHRSRSDSPGEQEDEKLLQSVINSLCSQFFAVVASHPFHVIMITSFAEFMYEGNSSMFTLARSIYEDDGCYGFFIGLAPRLVGELLSLTFSCLYTGIINKQMRGLQERPAEPSNPSTENIVVTYLSDVSRFNVFTSRAKDIGINTRRSVSVRSSRKSRKFLAFFTNFLRSLIHNYFLRFVYRTETPNEQPITSRTRGVTNVMKYLPLTSKYFYYMMIRDYISKKISYPFFLVCHCMIVLDSGWEKLPLLHYVGPLITFIRALIAKKKCD